MPWLKRAKILTLAVFFFNFIFKVPYTDISHSAKANLWPVISRWRQKTDSFELVNAYGLFRR